jgi:hypothetical protein
LSLFLRLLYTYLLLFVCLFFFVFYTLIYASRPLSLRSFAAVTINGELIDIGYLHISDAHVTITRQTDAVGANTYEGEIAGSFCIGADEYCLSTTDVEHSLSGTIIVSHSANGEDSAKGESNYVSVGSFITAQLKNLPNLANSVKDILPQAVKSFGIENAAVEIHRKSEPQVEYSFKMTGSPSFNGPATCDPNANTEGEMAKCALADCDQNCPSLSLEMNWGKFFSFFFFPCSFLRTTTRLLHSHLPS